jgi:hypothetical protein
VPPANPSRAGGGGGAVTQGIISGLPQPARQILPWSAAVHSISRPCCQLCHSVLCSGQQRRTQYESRGRRRQLGEPSFSAAKPPSAGGDKDRLDRWKVTAAWIRVPPAPLLGSSRCPSSGSRLPLARLACILAPFRLLPHGRPLAAHASSGGPSQGPLAGLVSGIAFLLEPLPSRCQKPATCFGVRARCVSPMLPCFGHSTLSLHNTERLHCCVCMLAVTEFAANSYPPPHIAAKTACIVGLSEPAL